MEKTMCDAQVFAKGVGGDEADKVFKAAAAVNSIQYAMLLMSRGVTHDRMNEHEEAQKWYARAEEAFSRADAKSSPAYAQLDRNRRKSIRKSQQQLGVSMPLPAPSS
jgi:hypothetical protein